MMLTKGTIIRETYVEVQVVAVGTLTSCRIAQLHVRVRTCIGEVLHILNIRVCIVVSVSIVRISLCRAEYVESIKRNQEVSLQTRSDILQVTCYVQR